jgi:hypothetical protein
MTGLDIRTALVPRLGAVGLGWYFVHLSNKVSISPGHDQVDPWPTLKAILDRDPIPGTRLARATVSGACLVEVWPPPATCKKPLQVAAQECEENSAQFPPQPEQGVLW